MCAIFMNYLSHSEYDLVSFIKEFQCAFKISTDDTNRVVLTTLGEETSYINASFIDVIWRLFLIIYNIYFKSQKELSCIFATSFRHAFVACYRKNIIIPDNSFAWICAQLETKAKTNFIFQGHETSKEYIAAQGKNIWNVLSVSVDQLQNMV